MKFHVTFSRIACVACLLWASIPGIVNAAQPTRFAFTPKFEDPDPGKRVWERNGEEWVEKLPSGKVNTFRVRSRGEFRGMSGTIAQKTTEPDFYVFIADSSSTEKILGWMRRPGDWNFLGAMEDIETSPPSGPHIPPHAPPHIGPLATPKAGQPTPQTAAPEQKIDFSGKDADASSVTFMFETAVACTPKVELSTRAPNGDHFDSRFVVATVQGPSGTLHRIKVGGLKGGINVSYYFLITAPGAAGMEPATYSDKCAPSVRID